MSNVTITSQEAKIIAAMLRGYISLLSKIEDTKRADTEDLIEDECAYAQNMREILLEKSGSNLISKSTGLKTDR